MATEQDREDVRAAREAWLDARPERDPERPIFSGDTFLNTRWLLSAAVAPRARGCA